MDKVQKLSNHKHDTLSSELYITVLQAILLTSKECYPGDCISSSNCKPALVKLHLKKLFIFVLTYAVGMLVFRLPWQVFLK
jgi:hypothetical protein